MKFLLILLCLFPIFLLFNYINDFVILNFNRVFFLFYAFNYFRFKTLDTGKIISHVNFVIEFFFYKNT